MLLKQYGHMLERDQLLLNIISETNFIYTNQQLYAGLSELGMI